jgi:hypothetical protein
MEKIPITPSSRQMPIHLKNSVSKSYLLLFFQEDDEGERGVGSGNPFGDDHEEEEVDPLFSDI